MPPHLAKENIFEGNLKYCPVKTQIISKQEILIGNMNKVLVIWLEDKTSYNISWSQSLVQSKVLTLFSSIIKAERSEESAEVGSWSLRICLHNIKVQSEAASPNVEVTENYPYNLAKIIDEAVYTKRQILSVDKTVLYWNQMPSSTCIAREKSKDKLNFVRN
jgi:hypothetical protein